MKVTTNVADVLRKLQALKKAHARAALRKGSRAATKIMAGRVKTELPKGETGQTRRGVKVRSLPRSRTRVGTQVRLLVASGPAYWAAFVELGTKRQSPQGNMRRAFDETHAHATRVFIDTVLEEIRKRVVP